MEWNRKKKDRIHGERIGTSWVLENSGFRVLNLANFSQERFVDELVCTIHRSFWIIHFYHTLSLRLLHPHRRGMQQLIFCCVNAHTYRRRCESGHQPNRHRISRRVPDPIHHHILFLYMEEKQNFQITPIRVTFILVYDYKLLSHSILLIDFLTNFV